MDILATLFGAIMTLIPMLIIFLILRGIVLWYWRVNEVVRFVEWQKNLLETNRDQNKRIIFLLEKIAGEGHQVEVEKAEKTEAP